MLVVRGELAAGKLADYYLAENADGGTAAERALLPACEQRYAFFSSSLRYLGLHQSN